MVLTCVAMYAIDARVTWVIPWMRALPERVAFGSLSTELGDVKICLNAYGHRQHWEAEVCRCAPKQGWRFRRGHSTDLQRHKCSHDIERWATGLQVPPFHHYEVSLVFYGKENECDD